MEFENNISYTSDILHPDMARTFQRMQTWLQNLLESFESVELPLSDPDVEIDFLLGMDMIRITKQRLARTQFACTQYQLLTHRIQNMERRLDRCTSVGTQSYTIWNQLQVYAGVREVYSEYLVRSSNKMVDCCVALDHFNEVLLRHFSPPTTDNEQLY